MAAHSANQLNENAQVIGRGQAFSVNVMAARGLSEVLRTNLGPKGTLKMLVGGAGQIKLTKDGNCLLHEMQIQHPTALMIARTATAQDDVTGDGTTTSVLFTAALLSQAERFVNEGLHPRIVTDGFDLARDRACDFLEKFKVANPDIATDRETLYSLGRTALRTKLHQELADQLTDITVDAVLCVRRPDQAIDLHMVEIMHMVHRRDKDTRLVKGLVLDHGARHPDMPKVLENVYILNCNVSMEYEKSEVTSGFQYSTAEQREKMVEAERKFTDDKVRAAIELKRRVCTPENGKQFVIVNQKGIDPLSLDMLAKEGILALRRSKRRNAERIALACGGVCVNSIDDEPLDETVLGFAGKVYEQTLGDDKYTFLEDTKNPTSCTILVKGPNEHTIAQIKEAVRDGLRSIKNAIEDEGLVPGGGCFELAAHNDLMEFSQTVKGRAQLGVEAFAKAMLIVPKTLAENSGFDIQDTIINLQDEQKKGARVGLDVVTGKPFLPEEAGVWDNLRVKRQVLQLSTVIANQLLLVDEVMKAGRSMGKDKIAR